MTIPPARELPFVSRLLARVLDRARHIDYLLLAGYAALPIALAAVIGVYGRTEDEYFGYSERLNWTSLVLILPLALFFLRWILGRVGTVAPAELPSPVPPVIGLVESESGRRAAYAEFRRVMLSPANLIAALLIAGVLQIGDMAPYMRVYLACPEGAAAQAPDRLPVDAGAATCTIAQPVRSAQAPPFDEHARLTVRFSDGDVVKVGRDWGLAYLGAGARPSRLSNLALELLAYSVQYIVIVMGVLFVVLALRHNLFFLSRIYQRRRVTPGSEAEYIHIHLDDDDDCFGFRRANDAFNYQVMALAIAALLMLVTRFVLVGPGTGLFPEWGQLFLILTWLAGLCIVSLPILVKLLPRLSASADERTPASLVAYLREFLSDQTWQVDQATPAAEIDAVARRFAANSFWPTGNNRAWQLYFVSFWIFLLALVPDVRALLEFLQQAPEPVRWVGWLIAGLAAWAATWLLFRTLDAMLSYVDPRLVDAAAHRSPIGRRLRRRKVPIGLFISYRRSDSAAYAGRLADSLARHFDRDRLFMDLDKIPGGADFMQVIRQAIESSRAMIVVIGPEWLSAAGADGGRRIDDPADFVHREIALAIERGQPIFPVLVGGAAMPPQAQLPAPLAALATRNARELSNSRWQHDTGLLVEDLEQVPPPTGRAGQLASTA